MISAINRGNAGPGGEPPIHGSRIQNNSMPPGKIQWPTGPVKPALSSWPINLEYLEHRLANITGSPSAGTETNNSPYLLIASFGGGPTKTPLENLNALKAAIAKAKELGINIVRYGAGTYVQDGYDLIPAETNGITIEGVGLSTVIKMSTKPVHGQFQLRGTTGVTIRNMTIDCNDSTATGSGGIWVCGIRNKVENVTVMNGDGFSICVIGSYSNGLAFVPTPTQGNVIRNCFITQQKRYHTIIAKAALLVAEFAELTLCENIFVIDNFLSGGETGDYVGNDHGLHTTFKNIVCIKTSVGLADGAALHLEGGEASDEMYVTVEGFYAQNFTVGTSISENTKARFVGQNTIKDCKYAIRNYGAYPAEFNNFDIVGCGIGLETNDIEGAVNNATQGIYRNVNTTGTVSRCAFVNYNGNPANSVGGPTRLEGCSFDKYVRLSYSNVGSYVVQLAGCTFKDTRVDWYNNVGLRADITNCLFSNSYVLGTRANYVTIGGGSRFETSNSALTFINLTLDTFNTLVSNTLFQGGSKIGDNVTYGIGIVEIGIANPAPKFNGNGGTILGNVVINNPGGSSSVTIEDDAISKQVGGNFYTNGSGITTRNTLIKYNAGAGDGPSSTLDIEGSNGLGQLRLRTSGTPSGSADSSGNTGDFAWDANYFYIKTAGGWKRSALTTF